jgi:hypothetical protein
MEKMTIPGIPYAAEWHVPPALAWLDGHALHVEAPPLTDLFTDPKGNTLLANSPRLMWEPSEATFTLSAHVTVDFSATFDAGVLIVWVDDKHWAKLCFEYSPQGEPMIVSVVNNGVSDDCNSVALEQSDVFLRVTRLERTFAFHYSLDGKNWRMVRYFTLQRSSPLSVGLSAQSPTGQGCRVLFDALRFSPDIVSDIRSGE